MSNKEMPKIVYSEYSFCIKGEDLKFFDKIDFETFKALKVKIIPLKPLEKKEDVR